MITNWFKKGKETAVAERVTEKANLRGKSTNQIIEEIHESFYTEVDRLLVDAKVSKSLDTTKQELIDKCTRLKKLGFTNTQEVQEAEVEISRLDALKRENSRKASLIEAIDYFSFKYPNYKFITEDSVKKICEKYNLVYASVDRYKGTVPNVNLKHIEDFKIDENDECYLHEDRFARSWGEASSIMRTAFIGKQEYDRECKLRFMSYHPYLRTTLEKCSLEIAAPLKDFNLDKTEVKNFKISNIHIPDPVVLQPVLYKGSKYFLVVTCWGLEASDELVVNQKMN